MRESADPEFGHRHALIQQTLDSHFLRLSFPDALEAEFLETYRRNSVLAVRRIMPFLSAVYAATCLLMMVGADGADVMPWVYNVLIPVGAALGWLWIALYTPALAQGVHWHTAVAVTFALVCTLRAVLLFDNTALGAYVPYHVVYVIVILFTVVRLRLVVAGLCALAAAGIGGVLAAIEGIPVDLIAFAQYYVITAFMCGVIAYAIEHRERADFLRSQLLNLEKQEFARLRSAADAEARRQSLQGNYLKLVSGNLTATELGERTLRFMAEELGVLVGAFFLVEDGVARRLAVRGLDPRELGMPESFDSRESVVGQMLLQPRTLRLNNLPQNYMRIQSSVVFAVPQELLVLPVLHDEQVLAVIEMAHLATFSDEEVAIAERILQALSVALVAERARAVVGTASPA